MKKILSIALLIAILSVPALLAAPTVGLGNEANENSWGSTASTGRIANQDLPDILK
jgi:hypothetical protein